jgi:Anti-sigma-K factor rskA
MPDDEHLDALAEAALNLANPAEVRSARARAAGDPSLAAELALLDEAAEALALGWDDADAPPGLEERVLAAVRRQTGRAPAPMAHFPRQRTASWRAIALAAAGLALVLAAGFVTSMLAWRDARDERDGLRAALQARSLQLELAGLTGHGTIYVNRDFSGGIATLSGIGPAAAGHHYQIWSEGPAGPVAASTFTVVSETTLVMLPALPQTMTRMFVTVEPDGAPADRPSGAEVLSTR